MCNYALIALTCFLSASTPVLAGSLENLIQSGALPKKPTAPVSSSPLINRIVDGNYETIINITIRPAFARTPIHIHENGAAACVLQGEETLYIEDRQPLRVTAPECYYMPSGTRMLAYNSGSTTSITYDIFKGPKGFSAWKVVEKDYSTTFQNQFGDLKPNTGSNSTHQH